MQSLEYLPPATVPVETINETEDSNEVSCKASEHRPDFDSLTPPPILEKAKELTMDQPVDMAKPLSSWKLMSDGQVDQL